MKWSPIGPVTIPLTAAFVVAVVGIVASVLNPATRAESSQPNVVIILVDTLRADALPIYGQPLDTAPFLTRLAEQSAVFERAFSTSSWTPPSVASIFTSMYPFEHGVKRGFFFDTTPIGAQALGPIEMNAMPVEVSTLPELFREAGYETIAISTNRNVEQEIGFRRGFDRFEWHNDLPGDEVHAKLRRWKREFRADRPHLVYVHLMDPHGPYVAHSPHVERFAMEESNRHFASYLSEVRFLDRQVSRIVRLFDDDNTLFVIVSDHGEEFHDHGGTEHGPQLYSELNRVVLMISGPGLGIAPQRVRENVSQIDILPTLLEAIEAENPAGRSGTSLWPILVDGPESATLREQLAARTLFAHRSKPTPPYEESWAAIVGDWKYIEHAGEMPELFDHGSDPDERANVASAHASTAERLASAIGAARAAAPKFVGEIRAVSPEEQLIEELRSLGYVN